jgi:hypothetical protein
MRVVRREELVAAAALSLCQAKLRPDMFRHRHRRRRRNAGITIAIYHADRIYILIYIHLSLSEHRLSIVRSRRPCRAYICLPIMSSADACAISALPIITATIVNSYVQLRGEERHPACCAHLLLPSRLYWRRVFSNWSWVQPEAMVWHHRHHLLRTEGIFWRHLVGKQLPWSVVIFTYNC